ncbi:MAG TPA: hypothetical protein VN038_01355 [Dyadobacter sp.]|nr:hypothetical protein [Dyadobacter sp.]
MKHADLFPGIPGVDAYLQEAFKVAQLNTPERRGLFLANVAHESAFLTKLVEDLKSYTAKRLAEVWPSRFAVDRKAFVKEPNAKAKRIAHDEYAIAEAAYGGRYGNAPEGYGDGWKYRGRGAIQLTFKGNYLDTDRMLGLSGLLVDKPSLVATPEYALLTAALWWKRNKMNAYADEIPSGLRGKTNPEKDRILTEARKKVNGGTIGLDHVKKLFDIFCF